jgi:hypothetical protein
VLTCLGDAQLATSRLPRTLIARQPRQRAIRPRKSREIMYGEIPGNARDKVFRPPANTRACAPGTRAFRR